MLFDRMSDEDVMCLHEFMDAGNGEAMYESVEGGMEGIHSADEYVALLKKSVDAGCYRAAEELACLYAQGERLRFYGNEFIVSADEEESCKYDRLAEVLKGRWEASNRGKILVGDFDGWMQIRCGEQEFLNSYLFPDIPSRLLSMCIDRLGKGILMSEWFSDKNHGHDISEEIVDGTPLDSPLRDAKGIGNFLLCEALNGHFKNGGVARAAAKDRETSRESDFRMAESWHGQTLRFGVNMRVLSRGGGIPMRQVSTGTDGTNGLGVGNV